MKKLELKAGRFEIRPGDTVHRYNVRLVAQRNGLSAAFVLRARPGQLAASVSATLRTQPLVLSFVGVSWCFDEELEEEGRTYAAIGGGPLIATLEWEAHRNPPECGARRPAGGATIVLCQRPEGHYGDHSGISTSGSRWSWQ